MWPFRRRTPKPEPPVPVNGHAAHEAVRQAKAGLNEAIARSAEVDKLAIELRRALGLR